MKRSLWCVVAILSFRCLSFAQDSPNLEIGLKPYGSYQAGKIDVVNLENGNVSLYQILRHIPQRGGKLDLDYYFRYNNKSYTVDSNCDPLAGCNPTWVLSETNDLGAADSNAAGVEVTQNFVASRSGQAVLNGCDQASNTCWYDHISTVALVDGGSHTMGNFPHAGFDNAPAGFDVFNGARSLDGTGLYASSDGTVTLSNGVRLYTPYMTSLSGVYLEDPNGNRILWTMTPGTLVQTFTDTLGRTLPGLPTSLSDPYTTSYSGLPTTSDFSGCTGPRQIQSARVMNFPAYGGGSTPTVIKLCFVQIALQTNFGLELGGATEFTGTRWFLQSIVLPDSTAWTFEYDSRSPGDPTTVNYGDLTKVTLPTGGTISYSWQNWPPGPQITYASVSRAVSTRTLNANDGTGDHTWTYQFSDITISPYTDTVTEPVVPPASTGAKSIHSFEGGYETQSQEFDSSGNLLKTIQTQFTGFSTAVGRVLGSASVPVVIKTTLSNGLVSEVDKSYLGINSTGANSSFTLEFLGVNYTNPMGSPTDEYIYDYGAGQHGPLLRHTQTDYEFQSNPNFLTLNLMSSVHDQITYDGAGNQISKTTYGYDESGLGSSGVSTQFNSSPINGTTRGNQTSVQRWLNTTNSSITSTATYFNTGSLQSSTDPLLHVTTHSYDTFYAGAYPTTTCAPQTLGVAHCASGTYDFNTGVLTSLTNENASAQAAGNTPGDSAHTTTYQYDSMLRIMHATGPQDPGNANASSVTSFQYSITAPFSVQRQTSVTTSLTDTFTAYFDGAGRQYQAQHFTPGCTAVTDTAYDAVGRVSSVSNPYCLGSSHSSDPTYGITQTSYDGIGRVTQITKQDGSISTVDYSGGNCTTSVDEAGKSRKSCVDALGRLTQVFEDTAGLNYETDYQYDALGNLLCVEQHGGVAGTGCSAAPSSDSSSPWRVRRFTYDSLSRLLTAHNPESGTITYTYDIDSNLLTKTDARGVVTNFSPAESPIDALHRVTKKTYSDGTPSVIYGYDVGCCGVDPINGVGRLTYTVSGNTELVYRYDAMGHITSQADCPPSGFQRGFCYWFTARYDLAGDLVSLQYPDLQTTITYSPDSAGRIVSVADNGHATNYVSSATYGPDDQLTGFLSGGAITSTFSYNKRLQPVNMSAATATQTVFSIGYDFHLGNGTSGADNGNIWNIYNYRDRTRDQTFTYDALNRLISARNAGSDCLRKTANNLFAYWGNTYTYDAWGNLTNKGTYQQAPLPCGGENLNTSPALVNNQLSGYVYDAAGNMTSDPTDQTNALYDAESRIKSINTGLASYTYNSLGNRVRKDLNGGPSSEYFYLNGQIMAELNPATSAFTNYVYFDGDRVARRDGTTGPISYYFSDHLKTASVITDSTGNNIEAESDYYPWGGELQFINNDSNHYKFTGKERDTESGLDDFGARYYSSALGRFVSADWSATPVPVPYADLFEPQSLNLYSYVGGNPASKADADGHQEKGLVPYKEPINPLNYKAQTLTESLKGAFHDLLKTISSSSFGAIRFSDSLTSNTNSDQEFGGMLMSGALMLLPGVEEDEAAVSAAKAFGFDKAIGGGKLFYGEFKNGAAGAFEFSSKGGELNVGVSFLTKISAETFNNIEKGAVNAAKASGSDSVTIEARMVKNPELQKFFKRQGFTEQLGKDGKGTGTFTKKIPVNPVN